MRVPITDYIFDASAKTITFSGDFAGMETANVTLIFNLTANNVKVYQFNQAPYGGVLTANVLTLDFDTTAMSDADELLIEVSYDTSANYALETGGNLAAILAKIISSPATAANQTTIITALASLLTELMLKADLTETQPVSLASVPLGTGAATSANQTSEITQLTTIAGKDFATQTTLAAVLAKLIANPATDTLQTTGNTKLDSIIAALAGTLAISAASLPLPSGASTSALQSTGNSSLVSILAALASVAVTGPLTDTQLRATAVPISATNLDVALSTRLKAADTLAGVTTVTTVSAVTAITNALPAGSAIIGKVGIDQSTPGTTDRVTANVDKIGGTAIVTGGTAGTQGIGGVQAHDAADSGNNPVKIGAKAISSEPAAVSAADIANLLTDLVGKLIVLPYANPENFVSGVTAAITDSTSTSLIVSPGGSLRNYVTHIIATNSHATVSTFVSIRDGSGGTILYEGYALAAGGGFSITLPTPLRQPTTATALHCKCETSGANVIVSASGYKGI